ncbi:MAG: helix-turn-helix domain-containing protein [Oscillospiraceae bacterium]|nr:helix-turn-helix domain-containing protein [Oscillospiraceae bacterium]
MKESIYKDYNELPLFLNAKIVAGLLGISQSSAYELMHEDGFPTLQVGTRLVVPKDQFLRWMQSQLER